MAVEKVLAGKVIQNVVLDRPSDMKNGSAIATTAAKCSDGAAPTYFLGVVAIAPSCVLI